MSFEVVSPVGEASVELASSTARVDTLNGKTVCEVWNRQFKGDVYFPIIRQMLRERYPGISIIPYSEMPWNDPPYWIGRRKEETARSWREVFLAKGVDAVISGNGG